MKRKRLTSIGLTAVIIVGMLAGCGSSDSNSSASSLTTGEITETTTNGAGTEPTTATEVFGDDSDPATMEAYGYTLDLDPDDVLKGQFEGQTLNVYCCTGEFSDPLQESIERFQELSGATVNLSVYSWDELGSKIALALSGDEDMDVCCFVSAYMSTYSKLGQLVNLTEASNLYSSESYDWDDFSKTLLDRTSVDGEVYAVPYQLCETMDFYRKDIIEDPEIKSAYKENTGKELVAPETKEDLQELARYFTKSQNADSPTTYGFIAQGKAGATLWRWMTKLGSFGGTMFGDNFKCEFNSQAGVDAMNYAKDMLKYGPNNWNELAFNEINTMMASGEAFICENWSSAYPSLNIDDVKGKIGCIPTTDSSMTVSGWSLGINALSEKQELAWRFIQFCTSPDGQMTSVDNGIAPSRNNNIQRLIDAGEDTEFYMALEECLTCDYPVFGDVSLPYLGATGTTIIDTYTTKFFEGSITAQEALDSMQKDIEDAVASVQ